MTRIIHGKSGPEAFDGGVYYSDGTVCPRGNHIKNGLRNTPTSINSESSFQVYDGVHLFGGLFKNEHFGHFFAESLCRLWATQFCDYRVKSIVFYLRFRDAPVPNYMIEFIKHISILTKVIIIREPARFETLLVPDQIAHSRIGFIYGHPVVQALFAKLPVPAVQGPRKIYVSRSKLTVEAGIICEGVLEENLTRDGYEIIHPQELSILDQIGLYRQAETLIFAEGSALHLFALFVRPDQRVTIVRRRPMSVVFDWQLMSFGCVPAYSPPCIRRLWSPERDKNSLWRARAELDFCALRGQLSEAGFVSAAEWRGPTTDEVTADLFEVNRLIKDTFVERPLPASTVAA
ncbi:glycosyltransferase family 61 protein [Methylobacterium sp. WL103]|uniref:glycosyltransferase family 61 protein n=1 Tax=Methylobacterium sp. WL103 TaxID=2603891 RepID=UPI0011D8410F|nr:glycosyltransferase 61 family protein [Methylobacterium sp. WL103]TXN07169.1 glycosyltransferase family 61 protein [Methylobacterium sp. WL103]